jgi:hypothetical protein
VAIPVNSVLARAGADFGSIAIPDVNLLGRNGGDLGPIPISAVAALVSTALPWSTQLFTTSGQTAELNRINRLGNNPGGAQIFFPAPLADGDRVAFKRVTGSNASHWTLTTTGAQFDPRWTWETSFVTGEEFGQDSFTYVEFQWSQADSKWLNITPKLYRMRTFANVAITAANSPYQAEQWETATYDATATGVIIDLPAAGGSLPHGLRVATKETGGGSSAATVRGSVPIDGAPFIGGFYSYSIVGAYAARTFEWNARIGNWMIVAGYN